MTLYDVSWFVGDKALLRSNGYLFTADSCDGVSDADYYTLCMLYGVEAVWPPKDGKV